MVWQFALMAAARRFDFVAAAEYHVERTVQNFRDQRIVLITAGKPPDKTRHFTPRTSVNKGPDNTYQREASRERLLGRTMESIERVPPGKGSDLRVWV
ncbi:hypothetical protein CORC01_03691 [Colletotrichum orchidophilum]|uniref:Uncharacterized protein n=1 Tax=Colletotrichum orchidophilum TaxID=1209926 RepID=A0A1G4BI87_9PEZI|nr:uncharacterized protein CORC01_03691 [Colletotrichum orchidophilum]OHF01124.1 hypothetical protein CORC01_03691 [Colletotrichum orchidophilum]